MVLRRYICGRRRMEGRTNDEEQRGRWVILTARSDGQRWSHLWSHGAQWRSGWSVRLSTQTNHVQPCGTLDKSVYSVFPSSLSVSKCFRRVDMVLD